jgi:hypothetical protein
MPTAMRRSSGRKVSLSEVRPSHAERKASGKDHRDSLPRTEQGKWIPEARRDNLVDQLKAAVAGRRADLLPIRWGRMSKTPFDFYRGAPEVMAADLGPQPTCGLEVQVSLDDAMAVFARAYADQTEGRPVNTC